MRETGIMEKFTELFDELEHCDEEEQKQKIEEMNVLMDEMNKDEIYFAFPKERRNKVNEMIEKKKFSIENTIFMLKHFVYCKALKVNPCLFGCFSSLNKRLEKMIIDEDEKKKEERNEKLLTDLCECYVILVDGHIGGEMLSICVPCLLKVALKKEENEEIQKDVEMALLTLSYAGCGVKLNEVYI
ncbi:uncharacterized protein MONOS_7273 [Monocercomonoides exilis]|uniref:uncharacterized protein n=1 Tax=Monocercomonoides exilis TaxID=2049356 RepID=UPI00355A690F|nr:hypothetical protein MONOS_7273 [Monocercomonoides exilis]|eukprot:MONOS_7273.1-p1 / transcript=MONOS_7273.1 / gene=MONOS_7273 / organism=Monocercomonoides_exilis_PA203 / gene_product=unspecified product / transcript_product=unspecified product / location=Mono_scaffold00244:67799-68483(+) / protein_length=186 / sequence_SO=supercontig / SO=protein_coding / is_pseudo=false